MNDPTLPLTGLSSVRSKSVVARFDGGMLSSNGGVLALAEVEKRLRVAERLAWCIDDPRCADQVVHSLADMIGFRMKMIAAGYEDGNDANRLRSDPVFKMAQDALPSGRDLASQSTICRLENLPGVRELVAMGRAMVDLYCASFRQVPKRIVLDIDDSRAWRPAIAPVQCPLRRIRLPADRGVRWRGTVHQRGVATGQAAEWG